jgi:hypothetical protein
MTTQPMRVPREEPADYMQVGLDVGKANDPSVFVVDHPVFEYLPKWRHDGHDPNWTACGAGCGFVTRWRHDIRGIEAFPLGMPFPEQARKAVGLVVKALDRSRLDRCYVLVDATGVGAAMVDHLRDECDRRSVNNVYMTAVTIGSGETEQGVKGSLGSLKAWVPTASLFSRLRYKVDTGAIRFPDLTGTGVVIDEAGTFEFQVAKGGRLRFGARAGRHDDHLNALALATLFDGQVVTYSPAPWA